MQCPVVTRPGTTCSAAAACGSLPRHKSQATGHTVTSHRSHGTGHKSNPPTLGQRLTGQQQFHLSTHPSSAVTAAHCQRQCPYSDNQGLCSDAYPLRPLLQAGSAHLAPWRPWRRAPARALREVPHLVVQEGVQGPGPPGWRASAQPSRRRPGVAAGPAPCRCSERTCQPEDSDSSDRGTQGQIQEDTVAQSSRTGASKAGGAVDALGSLERKLPPPSGEASWHPPAGAGGTRTGRAAPSLPEAAGPREP